MKIKVGDRVKFLNDTGGGTVSGIIDDRMVNVRIEDGFDIPVSVTELIIDYGENKPVEKTEEYIGKPEYSHLIGPRDEKITDSSILSENLPEKALKSVYFGMVPVNSKMVYKSDISTYLINDCDFYIYYLAGYMEAGSFRYLKSGLLEANTKEHVNTFTQTELSKIKKFHFQILFASKGRYFPQHPVDSYFNISKISFYKESNYRENEFFHENAYIFNITADSPLAEIKQIKDPGAERLLNDKEDLNKNKSRNTDKTVSDIEEVDLHIHEIVDDYSGLSEGEILNIQLKRFYSAMDKAVDSNLKKIVFIHGLGNGKLKYEIRKAIETMYPDFSYQDASFKEYGFGATLVRLE